MNNPPGVSKQHHFDIDEVGGSDAELEALVEALLLVASDPAAIEELALAASVASSRIEDTLAAMEMHVDRGWVIQRHAGSVELVTAPRFSEQVRRFLNLDRETRLSPAALETLAIVAYKQPVTRGEIEAVRGVDCVAVLATLHHRQLIESLGRVVAVGNPIQYGTTSDFLRHFGLHSLADLPPLGQVDGQDANLTLDVVIATVENDVATPAS